MKSLSPYPANVGVRGDNVFVSGKYVGYVDRVKNWGTDFLARPQQGENKFFPTKTEAVLYLSSLPIEDHPIINYTGGRYENI